MKGLLDSVTHSFAISFVICSRPIILAGCRLMVTLFLLPMVPFHMRKAASAHRRVCFMPQS